MHHVLEGESIFLKTNLLRTQVDG